MAKKNAIGPDLVTGSLFPERQMILWRGQVPEPQRRVERIIRPGVDFAGYKDVGFGTETFVLESLVNVADLEDGRTVLDAYAQMITNPVKLTWNDIDYSATPHFLACHILRIELLSLREVVYWSGSLDDTHKAKLECRWTLEMKTYV